MEDEDHKRAFFNPRWNVPNGYITVGWLLFLHDQIKVIIIKILPAKTGWNWIGHNN
jgi:hypothetical protein